MNNDTWRGSNSCTKVQGGTIQGSVVNDLLRLHGKRFTFFAFPASLFSCLGLLSLTACFWYTVHYARPYISSCPLRNPTISDHIPELSVCFSTPAESPIQIRKTGNEAIEGKSIRILQGQSGGECLDTDPAVGSRVSGDVTFWDNQSVSS